MARKLPLASPHRQAGVMTLRSLLLLFTGGLLLLILAASVSVSFEHFRDYVADQMEGHASDAATAAGLSLSNAIDGRDPVASASLIDAVFDSGRYLSVAYIGTDGEEIAARSAPRDLDGVPGWFVSYARLPLPVGEANVVRGWSQLGKVQVVSHPGRAYHDLWQITLGLVGGTLLLGGLGLALLYIILRRTLRPLGEMEKQAEALGRRDFRHRVKISSTRELNRVRDAMNLMADDLGQLFEGQAKLIQHLRKINNEDPLTGLASRSAFDQRVRVEVESEERGAAPGIMMLLQLAGFADYNQRFGREEADRLLFSVANRIRQFVNRHSGAFAGRRNGAEFAIYLPGASRADAEVWGTDLVEQLDADYADQAMPLETAVHAGIAQAGDATSVAELLSAADGALRQAQASGDSACHAADPGQENHHSSDAWRDVISRAVRRGQVHLWEQPLYGPRNKEPLCYQVMSRIRDESGWVRAGIFVPMAERLGLIADIDRVMIGQALEQLVHYPDRTLAVSLGSASVADSDFRKQLEITLQEAGDVRRRIWIGISEQTIHHHRRDVGLLAKRLRRMGVPVIVDHFGVGGVPFSYLRNLPFQALRIDHSYVHRVDSHEENRFYIESVTGIAHSRGVKVFATGVETAAEWQTLCTLGLDGAMGYHLGRPFPVENARGD
ncbi:EAL domain-containing protein [Marinobacter sp.]|uniref:bifunctional diguanylate cyclase/phosphodiesterase n=1 Tax=Marinobacter sp. TaxID=50741 RepID=UPI00199BF0B8|nr:EAL domain-containing protein [Marinobacter sp.]MBC7192756.1 EAL domain-containing protein [Marinobacter sp.]